MKKNENTKEEAKLISVIVPVYNVEKYLIRCIESIQKQTYTNIEIIIVDDGSPDGCPAICDSLSENDSRIKVAHQENGGLGYARNTGLKMAEGEYVTFVDSDDWIESDHIENLYNAVVEKHADIAFGGYTRFFSNGKETRCKSNLDVGYYQGEQIKSKILLVLFGTDVNEKSDVKIEASVAMNLYSMDIIKNNNLRFESEKYAVSEDLYFNVDFLYNAKTAVVTEECGYYYFQNFDSISYTYTPKRFERTLNFYKLLKDRVKSYGLEEYINYRVERSFLMKVRLAIRHIVLSDLSIKEKFKQINIILSNVVVVEALSSYPVNTYCFFVKFLTGLMKLKCNIGVYFTIIIREKFRGLKFFQK